jgi:hypothetical protein
MLLDELDPDWDQKKRSWSCLFLPETKTLTKRIREAEDLRSGECEEEPRNSGKGLFLGPEVVC